MKTVACIALLTCNLSPAAAQHVVYDAGTAGNPPIAPDPQTSGWGLGGWNGQVGLFPVSPDPSAGINAWEVADNTTSGRAIYGAGFAMPPRFEYELEMRMTAGPERTIFFELQDGFTLSDCLFTVDFTITGIDVIAHDAHAGAGGQYTCTAGADGAYHTYAMRRTGFAVELVYDGVVLASLAGSIPDPLAGEGVRWGARSDPGRGRARFHRVEFEALPGPLGTVGGCGPVVPNSTGAPATISAFGVPTVGEAFTLSAGALPPNQFGYFILGTMPGVIIPPGSQGRLCIHAGGGIGRFNRPGEIGFSGPGGAFDLLVDTLDVPTNPPGPIHSGEIWYFQGWYRDVNPMPTSNFTPYVRIRFQ